MSKAKPPKTPETPNLSCTKKSQQRSARRLRESEFLANAFHGNMTPEDIAFAKAANQEKLRVARLNYGASLILEIMEKTVKKPFFPGDKSMPSEANFHLEMAQYFIAGLYNSCGQEEAKEEIESIILNFC